MAYKSKKASATMRQLKDDLGQRLGSTFTLTESVGVSDNYPTLVVGDATPAAGEDGCFIKIGPEDGVVQALNAVGGTQDVFTPHIVHVAFEQSAVLGQTLASMAFVTRVLSHLLTLGMKVKVYHSANGVFPVEGTLIAGNLKVTIDQLWHPLTQTL
jgi:hypothetical protein